MTAYLPAFVSEFPDTRIDDCVPCAALMVANKVTHNRYPASVAEREALQVAMGTQDLGATNEQAAAGLQALLGLTIPTVAERSAILAALSVTTRGLAVIGQYQALPPDVRAHGNQPTYTGLHDVYLGGLGDGTVMVGDPLGSSLGPVVPLGALDGYLNSSTYAALVGTEQPVLIGYRIVAHGGPLTAYKVVRFLDTLYAPLTLSYPAGSWAPAAATNTHLAGYWLVTGGPMAGRYVVYGHSQAFSVEAVYSTGVRTPVPASS